ncbi:NTP transferase domain-containing protein [Deltaproteobacteria bacterium]|nr:NTP transferase domain-containing protein [Deltaproteobacteria bacterium]
MKEKPKTASIIFAAGKGSRMKDFEGNKTLLPLIPDSSPFEGRYPILLHILNNLPPGPKALVVNYRKEEVIESTRSLDLTYCEQPVLNGTGGALLASREFINNHDYDRLLITMGDVPFVKPSTFDKLLSILRDCHMAILGFRTPNKRKYGVLEIDKGNVKKIIEWKYWSRYTCEKQEGLDICNSGIWAARKDEIIRFMDILEKRPHIVSKERDGIMVEVKEFFITDLVELMSEEGLKIGYAVSEEDDEFMGVDDLESLIIAQGKFGKITGF